MSKKTASMLTSRSCRQGHYTATPPPWDDGFQKRLPLVSTPTYWVP